VFQLIAVKKKDPCGAVTPKLLEPPFMDPLT